MLDKDIDIRRREAVFTKRNDHGNVRRQGLKRGRNKKTEENEKEESNPHLRRRRESD
jgi:hypothetical protein